MNEKTGQVRRNSCKPNSSPRKDSGTMPHHATIFPRYPRSHSLKGSKRAAAETDQASTAGQESRAAERSRAGCMFPRQNRFQEVRGGGGNCMKIDLHGSRTRAMASSPQNRGQLADEGVQYDSKRGAAVAADRRAAWNRLHDRDGDASIVHIHTILHSSIQARIHICPLSRSWRHC